MTPLAWPLAWIGGRVLGILRGLGALCVLLLRCLRALPSLELRELLRTLATSGTDTLPLALWTATLAGALVVVQTGTYVRSLSIPSLLGWGAGYALLREFAPLLVAVVFSGRVGASQAAEIAALRAGEQLPALEALGVDVVRSILAPRLWAMVLAVVALAALGDLAALATSALVGRVLLDVAPVAFARSLTQSLRLADVRVGLVKAAAFGLIVGLSSLRAGLAAPPDAHGIGVAARRAVVVSLATILAIDALLTTLS